MTTPETPAASRQLELTVHFCRNCGIMADDRSALSSHLAAPENRDCRDAWDGGIADRRLRLRMLRFTADTGDTGDT